jgi:hypothetical protein
MALAEEESVPQRFRNEVIRIETLPEFFRAGAVARVPRPDRYWLCRIVKILSFTTVNQQREMLL